jgi:hypothetical protein
MKQGACGTRLPDLGFKTTTRMRSGSTIANCTSEKGSSSSRCGAYLSRVYREWTAGSQMASIWYRYRKSRFPINMILSLALNMVREKIWYST